MAPYRLFARKKTNEHDEPNAKLCLTSGACSTDDSESCALQFLGAAHESAFKAAEFSERWGSPRQDEQGGNIFFTQRSCALLLPHRSVVTFAALRGRRSLYAIRVVAS
jgi:hypothetical protein